LVATQCGSVADHRSGADQITTHHRAVELGFKKPKNPNLGFLGFLILLFYFNSF